MTHLLYNTPITSGAEGYTYGTGLVEAWQAGRASKVWRLGTRVVSLQLDKREGGGLWKQSDRLPTNEPARLLDGLEGVGVSHPSSYADCYHQQCIAPPRIRYTFNGLFNWWPGGAWSEARQTGKLGGYWYRYDLVSAYRWAATLGLPDPDTFQVTTRKRPSDDGLWMCQVMEEPSRLPPVFRTWEPVVLSSEEIERFKVRVKILRGVTWTRSHGPMYVENVLRGLPCAKETGRAFWGRWVARDPMIAWSRDKTGHAKEWRMNNCYANFIWGWLVVGRVRLRLWDVSTDAAHVYVDEVLVPHRLASRVLPNGNTCLGDWHLKQEYPRGVEVVRTGAFGGIGERPSMMTGVKQPSTEGANHATQAG